MNSDEPLVTVLMPCFNAMQFLPEALDSVLNQSYPNLEIITIDDGSSDGTLDYLKDKEQKDKRIKVIINEENLGLIDTLNKAVQIASGEYIARFDADDICEPIRIEKQLNFLQNNNLDLIGSDVTIIDEAGNQIGLKHCMNYTSAACEFASYFRTPLIHPSVFGKASVFKRNPYLKDDRALHTEDYELWTRLIRKSYKLGNQNEFLIQLRDNSQSVSSKFESIQKKNFTINAHNHYQTLFNETMDFEIYRVVVNRFESIDNSKIKKAIRVINKITVHFNTKSECVNINSIGSTQKFDILFQAFKKGPIGTKLYSTILILLNFIKNSLKIFFWKYLKSKFRAQQNIFK